MTNWPEAADVDDGVEPGTTAADSAELRHAPARLACWKQESEVL